MRIASCLALTLFLLGQNRIFAQETELLPQEPLVDEVAAVQMAGESVLSATQYTFEVPEEATEAVFSLIAIPSNLDIDLEVRFGQRVEVGEEGLISDYFSETIDSGSETVVVDDTSSPPLTAGTYYVGVVNFEMSAVSFFLTASHNAEEATGVPTLPPSPTPTSTPPGAPTVTPTPTATANSQPTATPTTEPSTDPTTLFLQRADLDDSGTIDETDLLMLQAIWKMTVPEP